MTFHKPIPTFLKQNNNDLVITNGDRRAIVRNKDVEYVPQKILRKIINDPSYNVGKHHLCVKKKFCHTPHGPCYFIKTIVETYGIGRIAQR